MKTRLSVDGLGRRYLFFRCTGCDACHSVRVDGEHAWTWNGDTERPTISPSIKVTGTQPLTEEEYQRVIRREPFEPKPLVCHSFLRHGQLEFLSDCTHALAGQTVPLPEYREP